MSGRMVILALALLAAAAPAAPDPVAPADLDRAIEEVLQEPRFAWRLGPPPAEQEAEEPLLVRFLGGTVEAVVDGLEWLFERLRRLEDWLRGLLQRETAQGDRAPGDAGTAASWLLLAASLAVVCSAAALLWLRSRKRPPVPVAASEAVDLAELAAEEASADVVEPDQWRGWGRELAARGELRLAVRAFHLATLSALSRRGLLRLARFKSSGDYLGELRWRGRRRPELEPLFAGTVGVFERVWYGTETATGEMVAAVEANLEQIGGA